MTYRYLLAAEADKIQDFIFRSSRLREVVGASQLLVRFCQEGVPDLLRGYASAKAVVNDAGSFRIIFEDSDNTEACHMARAFGDDLAEYYRMVFGGTISIAKPVPIQSGFIQANIQADIMLRRAKRVRQGVAAREHMPYAAFCASCGVSLADVYDRLPGEPAHIQPRYLCTTCRKKAQERQSKRETLLTKFLCDVIGDQDWTHFKWPVDADDVAAFDSRNYVAYLVADGNSMGNIFRHLDEDSIRTFSEAITPAVRKSLAVPTVMLMHQLNEQAEQSDLVPVLPLILGGDDVFALLPAPYALDVARRFCLAYEQHVGSLVQQRNLHVPKPTVAAAVVICKSKYPYTLAHQRAEYLLMEAKRQCKLIAAEHEPVSMVNFEVILGNRITGRESRLLQYPAIIRPTLRPYLVTNDDIAPFDRLYGIGLDRLLDQRLALKNIPRTRLAELRRYFDTLMHDVRPRQIGVDLATWTQKLDTLFSRSGHKNELDLYRTLETLGKIMPIKGGRHNWPKVRRGDDTPFAHGLPDLLDAWQFMQNLDYPLSEYEAEEDDV